MSDIAYEAAAKRADENWRMLQECYAQLAAAQKELELLRRVAEAMRVFADEDTYTDGTKVYNGDWSANMKDYARDALREWEAGGK